MPLYVSKKTTEIFRSNVLYQIQSFQFFLCLSSTNDGDRRDEEFQMISRKCILGIESDYRSFKLYLFFMIYFSSSTTNYYLILPSGQIVLGLGSVNTLLLYLGLLSNDSLIVPIG